MPGEASAGGGPAGEGAREHCMFVQMCVSLIRQHLSPCLGFDYFRGSVRLSPGPHARKARSSVMG